MNKHDSNSVAGRIVSDERGGAGLLALLFIALIFAYMIFGEAYFAGIHPLVSKGVYVVLGTIAIFCMGCALQLRLSGCRPSRQIYKELQRHVRELEELVHYSSERVHEYENSLPANVIVMSRKGLDCLGLSRKIVRALEKRVQELKRLLASKSRIDLIDAYELLNTKLALNENCYEALIDADPMPAIGPNQIPSTLNKLLEEVDGEIRKVA